MDESIREIRITTGGVKTRHAIYSTRYVIYTVRPEGEEWTVYDNGRRTNLRISYPYSFDSRALKKVMRIETDRSRVIFDTEPIERIEKYSGDSEEPFEVYDADAQRTQEQEDDKQGNPRTIIARTTIIIGDKDRTGAGTRQKQ